MNNTCILRTAWTLFAKWISPGLRMRAFATSPAETTRKYDCFYSPHLFLLEQFGWTFSELSHLDLSTKRQVQQSRPTQWIMRNAVGLTWPSVSRISCRNCGLTNWLPLRKRKREESWIGFRWNRYAAHTVILRTVWTLFAKWISPWLKICAFAALPAPGINRCLSLDRF